MRAARQRHIGSPIDDQLRPRSANRRHGFVRQIFQSSNFKAFLAQLYVFHPCRSAFGDLCQQPLFLFLGVTRQIVAGQ